MGRKNRWILSTVLLLSAVSSAGADDAKLPIPALSEQTAVEKTIKDTYKASRANNSRYRIVCV
jgi:hypothetical protein